MYAPETKPSVSDATIKTLGKKAVEQCQWKMWSSPLVYARTKAQDSESGSDTNNLFTIEALVVSPGSGKFS